MAYYNMGGQSQPSGYAGNLFGTGRVDDSAFKGNDIFGRDYYDTTDFGKAGYARFADVLGGNNQFKSYVQNKYPQMWNMFEAASGDDPTQTWTKWLQGNQDQMVQDYSNESPSMRGEQPGRTLGRLRWL
jgi:hypothetical protein